MAPIFLITGEAARYNTRVMTPPRTLVELLHDVCRHVGADDEALVLLDNTGAVRLGFPLDPPKVQGPHPILTSAIANGWHGQDKLRRSGWINLYADGRPRVHLCLMGWVRGDPMVDVAHPDRSWEWNVRFHDKTKCVYHTSPGVTGIGMLRERYGPVHTQDPLWLPDWRNIPPAQPDHQAEKWLSWINPVPDMHRHHHGYDAIRAYLRTAGCLMVARGALQHQTPRRRGDTIAFDVRRGGYWRIPVHPWPLSSIPDPAGDRPRVRMPGEDFDSWWPTTPTVKLLRWLADNGWYPPVEPLESFTAPDIRLFRRWAGAVRAVVEDPVLSDVGKEIYRQTSGMLGAGARRIDRPDWRHTWIADSRCWLWRKMWAAHLAGRKPIQVEVDAVWYGSHDPDPVRAAPAGFPIDPTGTQLGAFRVLEGADA